MDNRHNKIPFNLIDKI